MSNQIKWQAVFNYARKERTIAWEEVMSQAHKNNEPLPKNIEDVGDLYKDLRIDFERADKIIQAGGDTSVVQIDPRPEDTTLENNSLIADYLKHNLIVAAEIERRIEAGEASSDDDEESLYKAAEIALFQSGTTFDPLV